MDVDVFARCGGCTSFGRVEAVVACESADGAAWEPRVCCCEYG
jgi:hypothetical protein